MAKAAKVPESGIASRRANARDGSNPAYVQRRHEILVAAARVFKAKGLSAANLGDIADEAGADRASLYYYVGSKEELFQEVVREAVEANLDWARELRDSDAPAPDRVRTLVTELMKSYADNYPILYVFVQENLSRTPTKNAAWAQEMRHHNKEFEDILVGIVTQGIDDGSLAPVGPPVIVAYGIMGMVGWTYRWFNPETSPQDHAEIAATFAESVLRGLQVSPQP